MPQNKHWSEGGGLKDQHRNKKKYLGVPVCQDRNKFKSEAGKVWDKEHPYAAKNRGRPSRLAKIVFDACERAAQKLITERAPRQRAYHRTHAPQDDDHFMDPILIN